MALPYAQSISAAGMKLNFESMQNINDKEIFYSIFDIINTEYAAMASAGLGAYTVTTGLQASLEEELLRMGNSVSVEILKSFFLLLVTEYGLVQTNGLSYTQTDDTATAGFGAFATFEGMLHTSVDNFTNVENRRMLHLLIAQIIAEHVILVAAN
jgi:hypothetical protein